MSHGNPAITNVADHLAGNPVNPSQPAAPQPLLLGGQPPAYSSSAAAPPTLQVEPAHSDGDGEEHVEHAEDAIPPELEVLLDTDPKKGLSTAEAEKRLQDFGRNEIPEKKTNPVSRKTSASKHKYGTKERGGNRAHKRFRIRLDANADLAFLCFSLLIHPACPINAIVL